MLKKTLFCLWLFALSLASSANWEGGIHLFHLDSEDGDFGFKLQGLSLSLGREFVLTRKISAVPNARLGTGLSGATVGIIGTDIDVDLDRLFSLGLRTNYKLLKKLHLFVMPTYTNTEFTVSTNLLGLDLSRTDDDWDLGLGMGATYVIDNRLSTDLMFEYYNGKNMLSVAARFAL